MTNSAFQSMARSPVIKALICQFSGLSIALICLKLIPYFSTSSVGIWALLFIAGSVAAVIGTFLIRLPPWWFLINAIFPVSLYAMNTLPIPGWVYLAGFFMCLAVFWNVGSERVPLYLSNPSTWKALHDLIPVKERLEFIDLGSGIGGTIRYLASQNQHEGRQGIFLGIENAPIPYAISRLRQMFFPITNAQIRYGDIWNQDLSPYDVVYCFLSPEPMPRLYEKAKAEMKRDAILISNSFDVPNQLPDKIIEVKDRRKTKLFIWKI